jgi:hypothetical protein
MWVSLGLVGGGALVVLAVYLAGGQRPQTPRLEAWLDGSGTAKDSHPLGARLRAGDAQAEAGEAASKA